ncbi:lytic transglycosylase [Barnesiella viscericola DSM 18177]|uniref:Lytic transglycosylase n=1 Tax=Barnesiella viscericola DSM 18177 TaxID=880074 RepID=W0EV12_9BACT|nr:lytic transglycosylase [Barnesiella viscericola DSM 18177]
MNTLLTNWYMQQYAVVDDSCLETSVNIDYPDSVYMRKLAQLPTVIEMPYNSVVRRYIDMYVQKRRALVENLLGLGTYYMPIFEEALEREGLPLELKYLPIIESALRPDATSRAGAAGLWQFMVRTGKSMGLEVNSLVDERRDPIKSSAMAARYLKDLYAIYHDWALAIASYNCGPGNVSKAIRRSGGKTDYWEIYPYLPRETRGYVPAFIAVNYVMNYYSDHNICPVLTRRPLLTDTVQVNRRLHLKQVADVLQIPLEEIRSLNPQYRRDIIPGNASRPYALILPSQQVYAYIEAQDDIFAHDAELYAQRLTVEPAGIAPGTMVYHKVRKGETLSKIARKYGVSVSKLRAWNNLGKSSYLRIGQRLAVSSKGAVKKSSGTTVAASSKSKAKASSSSSKYHTVRKGESLWTISQKYKGVSAEDIRRENNLKGNSIRPGQRLKIPAA